MGGPSRHSIRNGELAIKPDDATVRGLPWLVDPSSSHPVDIPTGEAGYTQHRDDWNRPRISFETCTASHRLLLHWPGTRFCANRVRDRLRWIQVHLTIGLPDCRRHRSRCTGGGPADPGVVGPRSTGVDGTVSVMAIPDGITLPSPSGAD